MPTLLISAPSIQNNDSPLADLLRALEKSAHCAIDRAVLVTTDNPHVTALLAPFGRILPDENNSTNNTGGGETAMEPTPPAKPRRKPGPKPKKPSPTSPAGEVEAAAKNGVTIYTNPLTGEHIPYGQMRTLLANRRLVARERFVSNRHGLVEVRDNGKKLFLSPVKN